MCVCVSVSHSNVRVCDFTGYVLSLNLGLEDVWKSAI